MCKFCDNILKNRYILEQRSTYAEDNTCEFVNNSNCDLCEDCNSCFEMFTYGYDNDIFIQIGYRQKVDSEDGSLIIHPFSESIQWNYCPFCGKQISKNIFDFRNDERDNLYIKKEK